MRVKEGVEQTRTADIGNQARSVGPQVPCVEKRRPAPERPAHGSNPDRIPAVALHSAGYPWVNHLLDSGRGDQLTIHFTVKIDRLVR